MPIPDRHEEILRVLELRERLSVAELAERLEVSEVTVRKDLTILEEQGYLVRTRGGARLAQDRRFVEPVDRRLGERSAEKQRIGRAAAKLVRGGETIFLDSGSTCLALAREIAKMDVRVITNSLDVLAELAGSRSVVLHGTGGSFRADARSFIGPGACGSLAQFHIDRAFLGTSGIGKDGAFSSQNALESETKRAAIRQAERVIVLADASKIGRKAFSIFARAEEVHVLVTTVSGKQTSERRSKECGEVEKLTASVPFEVIVAEES